jgi:glycosyltransferase involved in cell wall biosynthesis
MSQTMPSQSQPKVSVITPVYNGEKYLVACIDSILAQTYTNWEYLIINNCSTDRSLDIAQQYARKDPRIQIHNNHTFVSVIQNQNNALRLIAPESAYCKIVHADDWLFPDCLAQMVQVAETHPSVAIVSAYRLDEVRVNLDGLPYPSTVVSGCDVCRRCLLEGLYVFGSPTSLLFRADVVRKRPVFYDEARFALHADTAACYDILQDTDLGFVHQVLTYTRRHNETESSFARRMNSYLTSSLIILDTYGPIYLSREEYEQCRARRMQRYYRFLGKSLWQRREKEFWQYHQQALRTLGTPLNTFLLYKAALGVALTSFRAWGKAFPAVR